MSGIEVVGLVLGAFPIAIMLLDKYREVADRAGLFYQIKLKHRQCRNRLECERLAFTGNLKELLLPLVADDEKITDMISNPGGPNWKDKTTSDLLRTRLKDSHDVYMDFIEQFNGVMKKLIDELALNSDTKTPITKNRVRNVILKTDVEYQAYRIKFSNGESVRVNRFKELSSLNKRLEQLLSISDKEVQLMQNRQANMVTSAIDSAICNLWINANRLFEALAAAWRCSCQGQHSTTLLLQHRDTKMSEFNVTFAKPEDSQWRIQETKISEDNRMASELVKNESKSDVFGSHEPTHLMRLPKISSMKSKGKTVHRPAPSVTLMTSAVTLSATAIKPITNLCDSLDDDNTPCYGYLPHDHCRYYVYRVSRQDAGTSNSVTLEQIFQGRVLKAPSRRQRLSLSFIISSSFLQILNTPWLTASWAKSDIMFMSDPNEPGTYALDRPHLHRNLAERDQKQSDENITKSLRQLCIILLELYFGKLLEDQPCRKRWPPVDDENAKFALDVAAALDWLPEVEGEAGHNYASAVGWCLLATRPSRWRQEMLRKVVKPLERCHQYLVP
ncbi:hypothetical protein F4818DRAFT_452259 [Hypoxylon cercidicola]|nr:hypothetical protein F4818DRAFT_452259 [Hypoxylon cercidicola]